MIGAAVLAMALGAAQAEADETLMRAFIAALARRDDAYLAANVHPQVAYDPGFRAGHAGSSLEDQAESVLTKTRKCDLGAVMRGGAQPVYTVNWWCKYQRADSSSPLEGAGAVLRVRDGKVEIGKFNWQGPFASPPMVRD